MHAYETQVHIGSDGILRLEMPVSETEADLNVLVVLTESPQLQGAQDTYGTCAGFGLQEPADLPLQPADWKP
jgi:hypothetical protein